PGRREPRAPVVDEVDFSASREFFEMVDGLSGELTHLVFQFSDRRRLEIVESHVFGLGVLGWVYIGEGVQDAQATPEELLGERVTRGVLQDRVVRTGAVFAAAGGEDLRQAL